MYAQHNITIIEIMLACQEHVIALRLTLLFRYIWLKMKRRLKIEVCLQLPSQLTKIQGQGGRKIPVSL